MSAMSDEATTPPTSRRREATRARLLEAAAQVFAETGLDAASVEAVCERAGFTRGAFYSNFESKDELFLELCSATARAQIAAVRERVTRVEAGDARAEASEVVAQVLEVVGQDRLGVLLLAEIRLRALRMPALATAYLAQDAEFTAAVAQIVSDIARAQGLRLRVDAEVAARLLLTTWTSTSEHAVLAGVDDAGMRAALGKALASTAEALLHPA
jgi:AcrR family transcriptional regulator